MNFLKYVFALLLIVTIIEAQKGGKKTKPSSGALPATPAERKIPQKSQPRPQRPLPPAPAPTNDEEDSAGNSIDENNEAIAEPPAVVPKTSFTCDDKPYNPGMYADMEVDCSVYHMCFDGRKESFLCGTGTMFNQEILSCDHAAKVKCADSPNYYEANTELGKPGAEPSNDTKSQQPAPTRPTQPRPNQPRPNQPRPVQPQRRPTQTKTKSAPVPAPAPIDDNEENDESADSDENNETLVSERPAPSPRPRPTPAPRKPSKTNLPKTQPRKPTPQPKRKPIEQTFIDSEPETNVRRAYRVRY